MAILHITEADAARDISTLLEKIRGGQEIMIDSPHGSTALLASPMSVCHFPLLSEIIADLAKNGSDVLLDDRWTEDLEAVIRSHQDERLIDPWESV